MAGRIQEPVLHQPLEGITGILAEPARGAAKTKTVSPGIHILQQPLAADAGKKVREHDLQVTNRCFLEIITVSIAVQVLSALVVHTDDVTNLMQQGMYRRIFANEDLLANDARFRLAPETAGNGLPVTEVFGDQVEAGQKCVNGRDADIADRQDRLIVARLAQTPDN